MVVTLNNAGTIFTVTSTNMNSENQSVKLEVNACGAVPTNYTISTNVTTYAVTSVTPHVDSVYSFKLTIVTSTGAIIVEQVCYFVGREAICDAVTWYKTKDLEKTLYYQALLASNSCIACSCVDLCALYTDLYNTTCDDFK